MTNSNQPGASLVYIWPDGTWCSAEERREFEELLAFKSDDYREVQVSEWDSDGSPAEKYFVEEEASGTSPQVEKRQAAMQAARKAVLSYTEGDGLYGSHELLDYEAAAVLACYIEHGRVTVECVLAYSEEMRGG